MNVPAFPIPVEGELYSSVIARYLRRTAGYAKRNLGLIGLAKANAGSLVPIAIEELARSMPDGHPWSNNPREIVANHTLVPLFLQSSNKEFYESTIEAISHGLNGNPAATFGLTKRINNNPQARYNSKFCPDCVSQDTASLGFPVLYRQHQPEFVKYCARHCRPLCYTCVKCNMRTRTIRWRMAGHCDCESPSTPMVVDMEIDDISSNSLLWLAQQVDHLLKKDTPHTNLRYILRDLLVSHNVITPTGKIRNAALISSIDGEIGSQLSFEFGFVVDCPRRGRSRRDLSRIFHTHHNGTNIIYILVVAKLFCDDIREVGSICESKKFLGHKPKKIVSQKPYMSKHLIQGALSDAKGAVNRAAEIAGLSEDRFRTLARHFQIALPLTKRQCDRIGSDLLSEVRGAIGNGMGFNEICRVFALGKHTTSLIFADRPDLEEQGKNRRKRLKIDEAKERISTLAASNPMITRTELRKHHTRAMDLVVINHSSWINDNVPKVPRGLPNFAHDRVDRAERLRKLDLAVRKIIDRELQKEQRPARLTVTRLKKDCAMTSLQSFPEPIRSEISNIFRYASESKSVFHDRLIRWSISEYAKLLIPISANRLRRLAGLSIKDLLSCRELVIKYAQIHNLSYHSRCSLSPFTILTQLQIPEKSSAILDQLPQAGKGKHSNP